MFFISKHVSNDNRQAYIDSGIHLCKLVVALAAAVEWRTVGAFSVDWVDQMCSGCFELTSDLK